MKQIQACVLAMVMVLLLSACDGRGDYYRHSLTQTVDSIKQQDIAVQEMKKGLFYSEYAKEQAAYEVKDSQNIIVIYTFDKRRGQQKDSGLIHNYYNEHYGSSAMSYHKENIIVVFVKKDTQLFEVENRLSRAIGEL
ncbi:hypothetical protein [Paenibacillus sp. y28]|uniref:hypothetical protein n=1 Tax=Paenibacillus sp. y28 TaxID=3129110 RepID=UPI00301B1E41